jgi:hypothetical protein
MDARPPLHLYLLAHPKSAEANNVASALMRRFVEPPASGGLRIPVFFTPDRGDDLPPGLGPGGGVDLDAARHSIVVVLADERMVRTVPSGTGDAWVAFTRSAIDRAALAVSPHHVLPVALEQEGFGLSDARHVLPATIDPGMKAEEAVEKRLSEISFHVAARALQLLERGKVPADAPDRMKAPVAVFVSHAKADLAPQHYDDPVRQTRALLGELPVESWYDAQQIATSQEFAKAISAGIRDCSILLAFQTDHYSSRAWCRREVLEAKRLGAHVLLVDALQTGEPRSFPYGGNVPTIRWQFRDDPKVDARSVVDRAAREALRFKHNRALLQSAAAAEEVVLPAAPEALTLAYEYTDEAAAKTFLYPDPPLGREELLVLQQLRPKARFLTPLTKLAQSQRPAPIETITVSISDSGDARKYGLSKAHFDTLSDEIHLYLLLAGLKIAYGGALSAVPLGASNFTLRLFELVRTYSKLAEGVNAAPLEGAVLNVAPWPLRLIYGDAEWRLFAGNVARYEDGPRPALPWGDEALFPLDAGKRKIESDTAQRRYAWARGLSAMRERITALSQARLVLGGAWEFRGLIPGVVEEAWLSLTQKKPLYVAGGLGGAARAVSDQLLGTARTEFSDAWAVQHVPQYRESVDLYQQHGGEFHSLERMGADIGALAKAGLPQALSNGLDETENRELMATADAQRIARLVMTGLGRL